jgi:hypothetical protein
MTYDPIGFPATLQVRYDDCVSDTLVTIPISELPVFDNGDGTQTACICVKQGGAYAIPVCVSGGIEVTCDPYTWVEGGACTTAGSECFGPSPTPTETPTPTPTPTPTETSPVECISIIETVIEPSPQTGENNFFGVNIALDPFPVTENVTVTGYIRDDSDILNTYDFSITITGGSQSGETANNVLMTGPADTATIFVTGVTPTTVTYGGLELPICGFGPTPTPTPTATQTPTPTPTATPGDITTFGGCGYGSSAAAACSDAGINSRTLYSDCDSGSFGIGCFVYVDTFPNPLTGYTHIFMNSANWDINSSTGVVTASSSEQC